MPKLELKANRLVIAAACMVVATAGAAYGQDARGTDPRLYPFLGCWRSDTSAAKSTRAGALTCVVPVSGSPDVEMLSVVDSRIASRRRLDGSARTHAIEGQGCSGQERTSWSSLQRRVYLRSEYVCSPTGIAGGSTTLFSFLPTGEWLEVESVHSGSGSIVRAERRRDAGVPSNLPREIAGQIGTQRLAVVTARAEAATPIRIDDVLEALRATDTGVVRVWLLETAQHFQLTGDEVSALVRASVPAPVLQAMMATPPKYQLGVGVDANGRSTDAYLSSPGWAPAYAYGYYPYPYPVVENVYVTPCCYPVYAAYNYYYSPPPVYTYPRYVGRNYYPTYEYSPYLYYTHPTAPTYRAYTPSYLANPVGVRSTVSAGSGAVHAVPIAAPRHP